jgi:hypothetical protein
MLRIQFPYHNVRLCPGHESTVFHSIIHAVHGPECSKSHVEASYIGCVGDNDLLRMFCEQIIESFA